MRTPNIKICIVVSNLTNGGLERTTALLSKMLANAGYDIHIGLLNNCIDYEFGGKLYKVNPQKQPHDNLIRRWNRFKKFRKYLKENNFDYIIDARCRIYPAVELFYLLFLYKGIKKIYTIHSFKIDNYLTNNKLIARLIIAKSNKLICVSKEIQKKVDQWVHNKKTAVIYNPIEIFQEDSYFNNHTQSQYILFLGRIDQKVKNLKLLIDAYKISQLETDLVHLLIVGNGPNKSEIKNYVVTCGLQEFVKFEPYTPHVYHYLRNALFLVLSSHYEGFPVVIVESLSVGTPVVSVNCDSGPKEIIINEKNGLLVENHNPQKLGEAMKRFFDDKELYSSCKENTKNSIQHLSQENIIKEWGKIFYTE